jgi:hypothetical protein
MVLPAVAAAVTHSTARYPHCLVAQKPSPQVAVLLVASLNANVPVLQVAQSAGFLFAGALRLAANYYCFANGQC